MGPLAAWLLILFFPFGLQSPAMAQAARADSPRIWNFDAEPSGTPPRNFVVGTLFDGRQAGEWMVIEMKQLSAVLQVRERREAKRIQKVIETVNAPSPPHVLAQLMKRGFEHAYKLVLVRGTTAADLELEVSFLAVAGQGDMGGGLIWRARDDRNYYLTRANPLEQNIRLYRIVDGVRKQLANFDQIISVDRWHKLRVIAHGERFQVYYDGQPVLEVRDRTLTTEGLVGLWTKADAVTCFDDLKVRLLE
jgi:hypothetical protein